MSSKMTIWDKILIFSLIVICFAWLGLLFLINPKEGTKIVEIKVYGDLVEKLILAENTEGIYSFKFAENTGYIEVKDGAVRMLEMDKDICPKSICSKTGWIKESYETIVCMPNGISVNIKYNENSTEKNNDIDAIA